MTVEVDIDFWLDYLVRFDVRVDLTDASKNAMDPAYTTQVKGVFAGVLEFLEWLGGAISKLGELLAAALSFIMDLVVKQLSDAFSALMNLLAAMVWGPIEVALSLIKATDWSVLDALSFAKTITEILAGILVAASSIRNMLAATEMLEAVVSAILTLFSAGGFAALKSTAGRVLIKVAVDELKKVLTKAVLIPLTVGLIVDKVLGLSGRDALMAFFFGLFALGQQAVKVFEKTAELVGQLVGKKHQTQPTLFSAYAIGVGLAVVAMVFQALGTAKLTGWPLLIADGFSGFLAFLSLLVLTRKWWSKTPGMNEGVQVLVAITSGMTTGVEEVITVLGTSATFLGITKNALTPGAYP